MRLPVLMLFLLFLGSIIIDAYIFFDLRNSSRRMRDGNRRSAWYALSAVVCWIFLLVVVLLPRKSVETSILPIMWSLYSYATLYIAKFIFVIVSLIGRFFKRTRASHAKYDVVVSLPLAIIMLGGIWYGTVFTRNEIVVNEVDVKSKRVPASFNGYRIVQFSDAHVGTWGNDTVFVSRLVDEINALHPDLILFTGDIVNRHTSELIPFTKVLGRLKAKDGVYSILGNHDYGDYISWDKESDKTDNLAAMKAMHQKMGWVLLDNDHRFIKHGKDSVALIGVGNWGEPPFKQYGDLEKAYPGGGRNFKDHNFKMLMTHNPEHWNQIVSKETDIDLSFSGHTHAMQMMISIGDWNWSPAAFKYDQWGGFYERPGKNGNNSSIYVNIGSGEVGMPARFGSAYPEVTLIRLFRK